MHCTPYFYDPQHKIIIMTSQLNSNLSFMVVLTAEDFVLWQKFTDRWLTAHFSLVYIKHIRYMQIYSEMTIC